MSKNKIYYPVTAIVALNLSFQHVTVAAVTISAAFLLGIIFFKKKRIILTLLLIVLILFFLRAEWTEHTNVSTFKGEESILHGIIHDGPYRDGNQVQLELKSNRDEKIAVTLFLDEYKDTFSLKNFAPGVQCTLEGKMVRPSPPANFFAFHYPDYLKYKYIHWTFEVSSMEDIHCNENKTRHIFYIIKKWRHDGIQWIDTTFPSSLKGIAAALIFGERHLLDADTESHYQKLGLIHLLAVSGLHVGLISTTIYYGLIRLGLTREVSEWVLVLMLPVYILTAGAAPSVIRASSVLLIFLLWRKTGLARCDPFSVLAFFIMFLLFLHPYYIFHVGFQLSFLISGSLLLSWPLLKSKKKREASLLVTFIAQIAALPVVLYHFYEFSFLSFILNLLFIPFISFFVLPFIYLLFIVSLISPFIFRILIVPFDFIVDNAHHLLKWSASWNGLQFLSGKPSLIILCFLSIFIFCLFYRLEKYGVGKKLYGPISLLGTVLLVQMILPYVDKNGYITILDVGQGDSILIELPYRKAVYLIDGGGTIQFPKELWEEKNNPYDPGDRVIVPYLKAKGISSINKLIVTHGDVDHYGGLYKTAEEVKIHEVIYGKGEEYKEEEIQFLEYLHNEKQVPITWGKEGDFWREGDSVFQILLPEGEEEPGNGRSVVIRADIEGSKWLFTGDLEEEGERKLLKKYSNLKTDLLKVGHHGSKTSSSKPFIEHIQPKAAFISAGTCNRFGHPHEETLQTLKENGVKVFRTDIGGAIEIRFDKTKVKNIKQMQQNTTKSICS
ncbi:DNA internalization-related competence protein ComEC/Rec2 [Salibacterium salarium]|uniref:DNA internalization-related competence protein ComEC/Rec2 n=1 Tax=Salibacterium salarium TaxID=284579 RepID=UPI00163A537E|nr:DNA internalization-related competence protein ComEC/Rec2 [Salibacterium salarium]